MKFKNETPMDDLIEVLKLARREWGSKSEHWVNSGRFSEHGPYIEVAWYGGHYDVHFQSNYYRITDRVFGELQEKHYIIGVPHWGYRDRDKFEVSETGRDFLSYLWEKEHHAKQEEHRKVREDAHAVDHLENEGGPCA